MLTGEDLEEYITTLIDKDSEEMIELLEGGVLNGRKAEQVEKLGIVGECGGTDCIPCENVL